MGSVGGGVEEVSGKCRRQSWGSVGGGVWGVGGVSEGVSSGTLGKRRWHSQGKCRRC